MALVETAEFCHAAHENDLHVAKSEEMMVPKVDDISDVPRFPFFHLLANYMPTHTADDGYHADDGKVS